MRSMHTVSMPSLCGRSSLYVKEWAISRCVIGGSSPESFGVGQEREGATAPALLSSVCGRRMRPFPFYFRTVSLVFETSDVSESGGKRSVSGAVSIPFVSCVSSECITDYRSFGSIEIACDNFSYPPDDKSVRYTLQKRS